VRARVAGGGDGVVALVGIPPARATASPSARKLDPCTRSAHERPVASGARELIGNAALASGGGPLAARGDRREGHGGPDEGADARRAAGHGALTISPVPAVRADGHATFRGVSSRWIVILQGALSCAPRRAALSTMKAEFARRVKKYSVCLAMKAGRRAGVVIIAVLGGSLYPSGSRASDALPKPTTTEVQAAGNESNAGQSANHESGRAARALGWVSLSIGAEAAVVAGVTSFVLLHEKAIRDDSCDAQRVCSQHGLDANATIASIVPWNTAAWVVAAVGIGAGAFLLFTNRSDTGRRTMITVSPAAAGVAVRLWSSF
jgi:hypothetical protein